MNDNEKIAKLLIDYCSGNIDADDYEKLNAWISLSKQNHDNAVAFITAYRESKILKYTKYSSSTDAYEVIEIEKKRRANRALFYKIIGSAAVLAIAVTMTLLFSLTEKREKVVALHEIQNCNNKAILLTSSGDVYNLQDKNITTVKIGNNFKAVNDGQQLCYETNNVKAKSIKHQLLVPRGCVYQLVLSDGTKVWLNSESRVEYPVAFNQDVREIKLFGEAYLEVVHDNKRKFIVETEHMDVVVHGTSFNVKSYPDDQFVSAVLVDGSISAHCKNKDQILSRTVMKPNMLLRYDAKEQKAYKSTVLASDYIGWKDGLYLFHKTTLENVMKELTRWYNVDVEFVSEEVKTELINGGINKDKSFADFLQMMEDIQVASFVLKDNRILVENPKTKGDVGTIPLK